MRIINRKVSRDAILIISIGITIASGFFLRGIFLTADPPSDISISGGIIADPGQYAIGARNKVLFDRWSFAGWEPYAFSPLMHYLNYVIYKFFGISYTTHKIIPLLFSSLTLLLLVFIVYRRFNPRQAFFTSIFFSFSYPVIIYSRFANREFPMAFFLLGAVYFFSEGARKQKSIYYVLSSLSFFLSFLSKGSGLFLLSLFMAVGLLWMIEKKTRFKELFYFGGIFFILSVGWYFAIYLPHKRVIDIFVGGNSSLRSLHGISQVIKNVWNSQFMICLRSDPFVLVTASLFILFYIYWKLIRKKDIDTLVELSAVWLGIGAFFHGIVSYRPTRFFVALLIPASILAGYMLELIWSRRIKVIANIRLILSFIIALVFFVFMGIIPYSRFLSAGSGLFKIYFFLFIILLLVISLTRSIPIAKNFPGKAVVILVLLSSFILNMTYYLRWAGRREYQAVHISYILDKALPPSRIAGNWASMLATGTRHKTYFAWKGFFNWEKDFLEKYKIDYLLLITARFADEIGDYKSFFKDDFQRAHLLAGFRLFNAAVRLYSLNKNVNPRRIEGESFNANKGSVMVENDSSEKMTLSLPFSQTPNLYRLTRNLSPGEWRGSGNLAVRAKGNFLLKIRLISSDRSRAIEKILFFKNPHSYKVKELPVLSAESIKQIRLEIAKLNSVSCIDYLELINSPPSSPAGDY